MTERETDEHLRELLNTGGPTTSARHDAAVLASARAFTEERAAHQRASARPAFGMRWAIAATVVALCIAVASVSYALLQRGELTKLAAERAALEQRARLAAQSAQLVSIALTPGLVRGESTISQLQVPATPSTVRLQLDLSTVTSYPRYRAQLSDRAGKLLWQAATLAPRDIAPDRALVIDLPSELFAAGEYELLVQNAGATDASNDPTYYYFAVHLQ